MGLTEKRVRDLKPEPKLVIIWDETVKGLGARVTPAGVRSYVLSYRAGGRKRLATLARCSEISLRDARERAGRELAAIREGGDPLARREQAAAAPTVSDLVKRFMEQEAPARIKRGRMKQSTVDWYGHLARAHVLPALGKRRVTFDSYPKDMVSRAQVFAKLIAAEGVSVEKALEVAGLVDAG